MDELDQWFYQRTGFYPTPLGKLYLKKFFLCGYLIRIDVVKHTDNYSNILLTAWVENDNVPYKLPL